MAEPARRRIQYPASIRRAKRHLDRAERPSDRESHREHGRTLLARSRVLIARKNSGSKLVLRLVPDLAHIKPSIRRMHLADVAGRLTSRVRDAIVSGIYVNSYVSTH